MKELAVLLSSRIISSVLIVAVDDQSWLTISKPWLQRECCFRPRSVEMCDQQE